MSLLIFWVAFLGAVIAFEFSYGFYRGYKRKQRQRIRCDFLIYYDMERHLSLRCAEPKAYDHKSFLIDSAFPKTLCKKHYKWFLDNYGNQADVAYQPIDFPN